MEQISIRKVNAGDAKLLFDWANDPEVRKNAFHSEPILWETHLQWFHKKLTSDDSIIFILEGEGAFGQIRFDRIPDTYEYEVDYSVARQYRGKSLGSLMIREGISELLRSNLKIEKVVASVKKDNLASIKSFQKNHFILSSEDSQILKLEYNV